MGYRTFFLLILLVGLVGIAGGIYFFTTYRPNFDTFSKKGTELPLSLGGKIYLSLVPDNGAVPFGIYSYNISSKSLSRVLGDPNRNAPDYLIYLSPSFSDDGTKMTFARKKKSEQSFQIYTARPDGSELAQITDTPEVWKREPVFSPSGRLIAYIAQLDPNDTSTTTAELPENWGVYLTDLSGKVVKVTNGVNPLFSPDEKKLLVLRNDGLHLFTLEDGKTRHIGLVAPTVGGRASQTMKVTLSHDRLQMAWSSPGKRNIVVSKINSWKKFSYTPYKVIQAKGYWTVFSPDGRYLAVQEVRVSPKNGREYVVLNSYNLGSNESWYLTSLNPYMNEYIWVGGWIE